jgi:hypothetical protein
MKEKTKRESKKNWAVSGEPLSQSEFLKGIKEAEKDPFFCLCESKKMLEKWKKEVSNKSFKRI